MRSPNKGTVFRAEKRQLFELDGVLPHQVTDSVFVAAADALAARTVAASTDDDSLHPPLRDLRIITRGIAGAVAREARDAGVGRDLTDGEIKQELDHEIWDFGHPMLRPI